MSRRLGRIVDPRLVVGILLVVGSVLGVLAIVAAADQRTLVYVAAVPLAPGDRLGADQLVERRAALDGSEEHYLLAGQLPDEGVIVTRPIRVGELVAVSALGEARGLDATAIVITPATSISGSIAPGSSVDVWVARAGDDSPVPHPPSVLVADAVVVGVVDEGGLVAGSGDTAVELLVARSQVARVLQALADEDQLAVVPAGLPWVAPS